MQRKQHSASDRFLADQRSRVAQENEILAADAAKWDRHHDKLKAIIHAHRATFRYGMAGLVDVLVNVTSPTNHKKMAAECILAAHSNSNVLRMNGQNHRASAACWLDKARIYRLEAAHAN